MNCTLLKFDIQNPCWYPMFNLYTINFWHFLVGLGVWFKMLLRSLQRFLAGNTSCFYIFYISWHPPAPYPISSCVMSLLYEVKTPESLYFFLFSLDLPGRFDLIWKTSRHPFALRSPNLRRRWRAPWWGVKGETAHHPHGPKDVAPSKRRCPKLMHWLDHPTQPLQESQSCLSMESARAWWRKVSQNPWKEER